jgi:hypothetical protein
MTPTDICGLYSSVMWPHRRIYVDRADVIRPAYIRWFLFRRFGNRQLSFSHFWIAHSSTSHFCAARRRLLLLPPSCHIARPPPEATSSPSIHRRYRLPPHLAHLASTYDPGGSPHPTPENPNDPSIPMSPPSRLASMDHCCSGRPPPCTTAPDARNPGNPDDCSTLEPSLEAIAVGPCRPSWPPLHLEATTVCRPRRHHELLRCLNPLKFCIFNKKFEC